MPGMDIVPAGRFGLSRATIALGINVRSIFVPPPPPPPPPPTSPAGSSPPAPAGASAVAGPRAGYVTVRWTPPAEIPPSTNLLPNSSGLNYGWGAAGNAGVITDNFAEAPDGNLTASRLVLPAHLNTDSPPYSIHYGQLSPLTAGTVVTFSVWLRSDAPGFIDFLVNDGGAGGQSGRITCHTTTQWQKFTETLTLQTTSTGTYYVVFGSDHRFDGQSDQPGGTFYAWGLQVEPGTVATPWMPTHYAQPGTGTTSRPARPILSQTVYEFPSGIVHHAGAGDSSMALPMPTGTAGAYAVSATNDAGEGPLSAPAVLSFASLPPPPPPPPPPPTPVVPGAPTLPGQSPLDLGATIFWDRPLSDGNSPLTGYRVTVAHGATVISTQDVGVTDFLALSGLTPLTSYSVSIQALNAIGAGPSATLTVTPAAPVVVVPPAPVVPGAPLLPGQTPLDGGALVFWNSPASDGGSPVTGYTVAVLQGAAVLRTLTLGLTDFTVLSGLVNGSSYLVTIRARNLIGTGPLASVAVVPAVAAPASPVSAPPPAVVPGSPSDTGGQFVKRDLQVNFTTGRLAFVEGDLVFSTGAQAILQDVWLALGFFEGEWFLDESVGVPVFRMVLVKGPNLDQIRALYRDTIAGRLGVKSVLSLLLTVDAPHRALSISFRINTDVGQLASARTVRIGG